MLFFAAFGAMLLTSVLFLTGPWGRDVLQAGLEIAPGPAMAAALQHPRRHGSRAGSGWRRSAPPAPRSSRSRMLWWLTQLGPVPDYAGEFLPGMVICGIGVGLVIPTITAAAAVVLPPERFATGTGVLTMGRQVGVAIGVAVLVALLGDPKTAATSTAALRVHARHLRRQRARAARCSATSRLAGRRASARRRPRPNRRPHPRRWRHDRPGAARRASGRGRSRRPASPSSSASRSRTSRRAG